MFKKKKRKKNGWALEWGGTVSQPSPLLFLSLPSPHLLHSCKPLWLREERPPFQSLYSPPLFPLPELTVGTIKTLKRGGWGKGGEEKKSWGVGGREWDPLVVVGNKSQTLWEQQEPSLHHRGALQSQVPPKGPHPVPQHQTPSSAPVLILLHTDPLAISLTHNLRAPSLLPLLSESPTAPGHRDFSSPGATFTLAPGSALPLNHNTAIQHMLPSYSSSLALCKPQQRISQSHHKRAESRNLATAAAL